MPESNENHKSVRRAGGQAVIATLLTLGGPIAYILLLDNARMRASGAPAFGLMAAGAALGLGAILHDKRWRIRLPGMFNIVLLSGFIYAFFWAAALPAPDVVTIGEPAPEFVLPDQHGSPVMLAEYRDAGPVLLVFYRGHW